MTPPGTAGPSANSEEDAASTVPPAPLSPVAKTHDDLLSLFFSYLAPADVVSCSRVCKKWYYLTVGDESLWETLLAKWLHIQPPAQTRAASVVSSAGKTRKGSASLAAALAAVDLGNASLYRPLNPSLKRFASAWTSKALPKGKFSLPASTKVLMMTAAAAVVEPTPASSSSFLRSWLSLFFSDSCKLFRGPLVRHLHSEEGCIRRRLLESMRMRREEGRFVASDDVEPLAGCYKAVDASFSSSLPIPFGHHHHRHHHDSDEGGAGEGEDSDTLTCEACALKKQIFSSEGVMALHAKLHHRQAAAAGVDPASTFDRCERKEIAESKGYLLVKLVLQNSAIGGGTPIAVVPSRISVRLKMRGAATMTTATGSSSTSIIYAHAQAGKSVIAAFNGKEHVPPATQEEDDDAALILLFPSDFAVLRLAFPFDSLALPAPLLPPLFEPEALEMLERLEVPVYSLLPSESPTAPDSTTTTTMMMIREGVLTMSFGGGGKGSGLGQGLRFFQREQNDDNDGDGSGCKGKREEAVAAPALTSAVSRRFAAFNFDESGAALGPIASSSAFVTPSGSRSSNIGDDDDDDGLEGRIWQLYRPLPGGAFGAIEGDVGGGGGGSGGMLLLPSAFTSSGSGSGAAGW